MGSEERETHLGASHASHGEGAENEETLSPLEQEVLDEYARLLGNLNNVRSLSTYIPFSSAPSLPFLPVLAIIVELDLVRYGY